MRRRRPLLRFAGATLLLALLGAVLLASPLCSIRSARAADYFWSHHLWQCAFDSLSAVCACGLLTRDLTTDINEFGRWVLVVLGMGGGALAIGATLAALRRCRAALPFGELPSTWRVVALWTVVSAVGGAFSCLSGESASVSEGLRIGVSGIWSLGAIAGDNVSRGVLVVISAAVLVGWPSWLLLGSRGRFSLLTRRHHVSLLCGAFGVIALFGSATSLSDTPRGRSSEVESSAARWWRSVSEVTCVAGSGLTTESLDGRNASEGRKLVLGGVMLCGGLGMGITGGVGWLLLGGALCAVFRPSNRNEHGALVGVARLGVVSAMCFVLLALVGALGLLLIDTVVASRFAPPVTLADAWVDACSATAGGSLTTGVVATLTDVNLASGIRVSTNLFPLGFLWLMLLMLLGRLLPVWILQRLAPEQS